MKALIVKQKLDKHEKNTVFKVDSESILNLYLQTYPNNLVMVDLPENYDSETFKVSHIEHQQAKWTKEGEDDRFSQPIVTYWHKYGEENLYEDPEEEGWEQKTANDNSWTYNQEVQESWSLVEDSLKATAKRQQKADLNLTLLRQARQEKLNEADYSIFKIEDEGGDSSAWRAYRVELRTITDQYKKQDGTAKLVTENLDIVSFSWPSKP